ncbi:MAG TPA: adenylate/guanylate cyclase domain-containing protein [Chloroflexota bacterium]|nr:adenylate/guanylate cyclase domain-containing protein [Chloroflexota bacterium]
MTERQDKLGVLYEVGRYINSSLDLQEVLDLVMESLIRVTGAERGLILLVDPASGERHVAAARNFDPAALATPACEISRHVVQAVLERETPLLVSDALSDPHYQQFQSVVALRLRSILCAPLSVKGRTIGVVYVDNRRRAGLFTPSDLELLVAFADQAAIAIENARLHQSLQARLREIADLQAYQDDVLRSVASGVIALDPAGRITTFNAAAEAIFGVPAGQALNAPYDAVLGPDMSQFLHAYRAGAQLGGAPPGAGHDVACELPGRGRVYLSARVTPLRTAAGQETGLVLALEDQTEKRLLEKARRAEEEKRQLLSRFFAPSVLDEILRNPAAAATLGGVRKEISVLFADIRGYTTISERMAPEEVVALLNRYLEEATRAIRACEGTVDKYIGDAVVALFNAPTEQPDHAVRAVWAALALQGGTIRLRRTAGREVHFGIGVNTGEAVAGYIGTADLMSYTAIGDAVNVAARLQASARAGEVLISEATYERVGGVFAAERLGALDVKGRRAPVVAYRVLGPRL